MSHRTRTFLVPALVALVALAAVARVGSAQPVGTTAQPAARMAADRTADEQAIRTLSERWLAAQRKMDVDAILTNFASDAAAVYGGKLLNGRDAIRRNYESDFATLPKERPGYMPSWKTTRVEVAQAGDLAYEAGTYEDTWNGGKGVERGNYLTVWRKVGGDWKVARDMATPESKPASKKPAP